MDTFACFSLNPANLDHPGLAIATARAGGTGLLDLEFCVQDEHERVAQNIDRLVALTEGHSIGLRLRLDQISSHQSLLDRLANTDHWIVICAWSRDTEALDTWLESGSISKNRRILLEVTDASQVAQLNQLTHLCAGLIAKGHESCGWVGEDSAFILMQKLLRLQSLPVYVQGGIGLHTTTACRAAGAAGVVLDDQLWLMPESPLPREWHKHLTNLNGQEAIPIGERVHAICRVLSRPGFRVISTLQQLVENVEVNYEDPEQAAQEWYRVAQPQIGWGQPGIQAWPIGQSVGLAVQFRDRFKTTGRLIQSLMRISLENLQEAQALKPLHPHAPLAQSHGTQYPIVQGPMTRVSDTAEFAHAVTEAGALPLLALALMRGKQVEALLRKTKELVGDRPWGVGMLGFAPQDLREAQIEAVRAVKPPFALIAGGRPDQAAHFESMGIATYIHVPVPRLLKMFLEQGARRFVFEGRECGGHVGPLSSFVLWESMIETLLTEVPAGAEADVHVLFAGGIHDPRSAAMVAAMAAPLMAKGIRIGVLMGTAYLFTQEAVQGGAIVQEFQEQALLCDRTINLESGPGHATRCAVTPFAHEFYSTRRQMLAEGASAEEIKNALEALNIGRLRIASKGLTRDKEGQIITVEPNQQLSEGMYMIGQVATLRDKVCSVKDLHESVSVASMELLEQAVSRPVQVLEPQKPKTKPSDIAIIGIGTLLPQSHASETFWRNILDKVDAITEIPRDRWDWRLYYDADRNARDRIYSKWGGFIGDVPFDPLRFGIPPKSLKSIEPMQLLALETVRRALEDAGYGDGHFDREHTCVILGAGGGIGDLGGQYATRSEVPRYIDVPPDEVWDRLPEWTEETFPGLLMNVIAGRIANRFDFGGSNFTVDAACASSLASVDLAVAELESGRSNVAVAGGVDAGQSPFAYFCFSKTRALSPRGRSHSFDKNADGICISEGIAMLVLKRVEDAERDGDRIYAVIKAVAGSSDGKALGMTAPRPAGQRRALSRAYQKAGFSPSTLGMYEAHGTGTAAGDKAELETITTTLMDHAAQAKSCMVGSVKTMTGHTKSSAGVAGLIKVALALHHKVLPPHRNVENPLDSLVESDSPVYLLKDAQPWFSHPGYPRRGGVSAFGFGGTNFHAVVEEYQGQMQENALGSEVWPCELLVFRADDRAGLTQELRRLQKALQEGAEPRLADLAYTYAQRAQDRSAQPVCLAIVADSLEHLNADLEIAQAYLAGQRREPLPLNIQLGEGSSEASGKVAFLFSGQGSQYPEMLREATLYLPELRHSFEVANLELQDRLPRLLSQYIFPPSSYSEDQEAANKRQLMQTHIAQPAIGTVSTGLLDLMTRLGLRPDMVAGHSFGEFTALHAAGVLSRHDFLQLSEIRGRVMATACEFADGAMAAIQASREDVLKYIKGLEHVVLANHNAPLQSVVSGQKQSIVQLVDRLNAEGVLAKVLPVSGAFHSTLVAPAQTALAESIQTRELHLPQLPIYANATARPYSTTDLDAVRQQLSEHLLSSVEFVHQIETMYADGARIFVELGPKSVLTNLVNQILADQKPVTVAMDGQGGGLQGLLTGLGILITHGASLKLTALFQDRAVQQLELNRLVETTRKPPFSPTTWMINGGGVRPHTEAVGYTGKLPPLMLETKPQPGQSQNGSTPATPAKPTAQPTPATPVASPAAAQSVGFTGSNGSSMTSASSVASVSSPAPVSSGSSAQPAPMPRSASPAAPKAPSPAQQTARTSTSGSTSSSPRSQPHHPMTYSAHVPPNGSPDPYAADEQTAEYLPPSSQPGMIQTHGEAALIAYQVYQDTMRHFLSVQERVMSQFLTGSAAAPSAPAPTAFPRSARPQRLIQNRSQQIAPSRPAQLPAPQGFQPPVASPAAPSPMAVS